MSNASKEGGPIGLEPLAGNVAGVREAKVVVSRFDMPGFARFLSVHSFANRSNSDVAGGTGLDRLASFAGMGEGGDGTFMCSGSFTVDPVTGLLGEARCRKLTSTFLIHSFCMALSFAKMIPSPVDRDDDDRGYLATPLAILL